MELFSIPILSLIAGFFALLLGVKVIARNDEISQVWQLAFASLFLFGAEVGFNFVVDRFAPDFTSLILVGMVMCGVGIVVLLSCVVFFSVPFSRAVLIAVLFMVTKGAVAIHFGSKEFGEYHRESRLLTLYEPKIQGTGDLSILRDPNWETYEVGELSMALPKKPEEEFSGNDGGETRAYWGKYRRVVELGDAKLEIEYWNHRKASGVDRAKTIGGTLDSYAFDNPASSVDLVEKEFETIDPDLDAWRGLLWIGDPVTDPLAVPLYFLSMTRGSEEWFLRASGERRLVEQLAQFTFSSIQANSPKQSGATGSASMGDPGPASSASSFPVQRTLRNAEGREVDANIIGRSETELIFLKENREFRYQISDLSAEDQEFVKQLPLTE